MSSHVYTCRKGSYKKNIKSIFFLWYVTVVREMINCLDMNHTIWRTFLQSLRHFNPFPVFCSLLSIVYCLLQYSSLTAHFSVPCKNPSYLKQQTRISYAYDEIWIIFIQCHVSYCSVASLSAARMFIAPSWTVMSS